MVSIICHEIKSCCKFVDYKAKENLWVKIDVSNIRDLIFLT